MAHIDKITGDPRCENCNTNLRLWDQARVHAIKSQSLLQEFADLVQELADCRDTNKLYELQARAEIQLEKKDN